jgi:hypothetical protein
MARTAAIVDRRPRLVCWRRSQQRHYESGVTASALSANGLCARGLCAKGLCAKGLCAKGLCAKGLCAKGLCARALCADPAAFASANRHPRSGARHATSRAERMYLHAFYASTRNAINTIAISMSAPSIILIPRKTFSSGDTTSFVIFWVGAAYQLVQHALRVPQ